MSLRHLVVGCFLGGMSSGVAEASPPRLSASAALGGGYDDNLNGAVAVEDRSGSPSGSWTVGGALSSGAAAVLGGRVGLSVRGRYPTAVPELTSHTVSATVSGFASPGAVLSLSLTPRVAGRWVSDADRSSVEVGATLSARLRASRWLALGAGYDVGNRWAREAVFGGTTHTVYAGPELHLARNTWIGAEYSLGLGPMVRYEPVDSVSATAPSRRTGQPTDGSDADGTRDRRRDEPTPAPNDVFGEDLVAVRIPALSHTILLDVEQGLGDQIYVRVSGGLAWVRADDETSVAHFAQGTVGVRLP